MVMPLMRVMFAVTTALLLANGPARAQGSPEITPEMSATELKLLAKAGPQTRSWIKEEAARQRAGKAVAGTVNADSWRTHPSAQNLTNADIMALAFLVMMEASRSATEDLKSTMAGVKAINAEKASVRETQRTTTALGDAQSLRLQLQMDRRAKMLETASNLMRKMAEAGSTTVQNLK